jgi:hypothetical protein
MIKFMRTRRAKPFRFSSIFLDEHDWRKIQLGTPSNPEYQGGMDMLCIHSGLWAQMVWALPSTEQCFGFLSFWVCLSPRIGTAHSGAGLAEPGCRNLLFKFVPEERVGP